jgi:hypothetical protein
VKRPLRELDWGTIFRTGDGRFWRVGAGTPVAGLAPGIIWCQYVGTRQAGGESFDLGTVVEPLDLPALLARVDALESENRELRAWVSDLWDESRAARLGAEAGRGAVLVLVMAEWAGLPARADAWEPAPLGDPAHRVRLQAAYRDGCYDALGALVRRVLESPDPGRPPVPPHRLEGALREAEEVLQGWHDGSCRFGTDFGALLARLREALGEGS